MLNIKMTPRAQFDINSIINYINRNNPMASRKIAEKIDNALDYLREHPEMGKPYPALRLRVVIISGTSYKIIYEDCKNYLKIYRVLHSAQMIEALELMQE